MANYVLLNNVEHKDLKVITHFSSAFGDAVSNVITFPSEFSDIQREYPIFFRKDINTGQYVSVAILGFEKCENLYIDGECWCADYIPCVIEKGPFAIGFQEQIIDGQLRKEPVIHVNMDSPRLSEVEGQPIFTEHGGNSHYIERVAYALNRIHSGMSISSTMFDLCSEFDLIEPVNIELTIDAHTKINLQDYFTINEDKLSNLSGQSLEKLNKAGFLQSVFFVISSMNNMKKLISMKRKKLESTVMDNFNFSKG